MRPIPVTLALVLLCQVGHAQYRPPPPTEAQTLTTEATNERTEAAQQLAAGNRAGAEQGYRKSIQLYQEALKADPGAVAAASGLGDACLAIKQYDTAISTLTPFHVAHPEVDDVNFALGVALFKQKHYPEALPLLDTVSRANKPEHFIAHYYRGSYALLAQEGDKSFEELTLYLSTRPVELASDDYQLHELLGRAQLLRKKPAEARKEFLAAQKGRPESLTIQIELESVLEMEGHFPEAIAALDALLKRYPNRPEIYERLAYLYYASKSYSNAAAAAVNLIKLQKTPQAYVLLGEIRFVQSDWAAAEAQYREALKLVPDHVPAEIGLGRTLQKRGKNAEALALLERGAKARPQDVTLWAALGSAYRRAGRYQDAVTAHGTVSKLAPQDPLGSILVGADHFATGQWDETIEDYSAALKLDGNNVVARHWLARALLRRVQSRVGTRQFEDNALFDLRRAYDLEHTALMAQALGAVLLHAKQNEEARTILSSAVTLPDATWQLSLLLGYASLGAGDAAAAVTAFERSAKLTHDPSAETEVYLGWALAKIELGDYELAVSKLQTTSESPSVSKVMQANLPVALLRLGFKQLQDGDVAGAAKELAAALALPGTQQGPVAHIAELLRSLIAVENKQFAPATTDLSRALAGQASWVEPIARPLLEAYLEYRKGHPALARKPLGRAQKMPGAAKLPFIALFTRAINLLEAEQLYNAGQLPRAEQLLKVLAQNDPLNVTFSHDLACLHYRKNDVASAVKTWQSVADTVREATLNLGYYAQDKQHDPKGAIAQYKKYIAASGSRTTAAQEPLNRLISLYGDDAGGAP